MISNLAAFPGYHGYQSSPYIQSIACFAGTITVLCKGFALLYS